MEIVDDRRRELKRISKPVALVFWGAVFAILDFRLSVAVETKGFGVNLLPDWLGLVLLTIGAARLAFGGWLEGRGETAMTIAAAVFASFACGSILGWFVPELRQLPDVTAAILQLVAGGAIAAFCYGMAELTTQFGLIRAASRWLWIGLGTITLYTLPRLLVFLFPRLEVAFTLLAWLLVVPLAVAIFVSLREMRHAHEAGRARGWSGAA